MELICKRYRGLCRLSIFKINGIEAELDDFGENEDIEPQNAEPYGCGNMKFIPKLPTGEIIKKYNITVDEYAEICSKLDEQLSFGSCGMCI